MPSTFDGCSDLLSVTEVAQVTGLNRSYIGAEIRAGRLKASKVGRAYIIRREDAALWYNNPQRGERGHRST